MSTPAAFDYPFEEFMQHYRDIHLQRDNPPTSFETAVIRTFEYMTPLYETEEESLYKATRFMLIMQYLAERMDDFDVDDLAVMGSARTGGLVGQHLLWAVHYYFTSRPLQSGHGPSPDLIKALASQYKERIEDDDAV